MLGLSYPSAARAEAGKNARPASTFAADSEIHFLRVLLCGPTCDEKARAPAVAIAEAAMIHNIITDIIIYESLLWIVLKS